MQINQDLERESVAVACRRFKGTHSYDKIAELIDNINSEFGISYRNIVATVTDNGSNFAKCFKEFGVQYPETSEESNEQEDIGSLEETEDAMLPFDVDILPCPDVDDEAGVKLSNHL